jgi:hypothetical protein
MARMRLAGLGGIVLALKAVPGRQMGVVGTGRRVFCGKAPFGFPVVHCSFLVMMGGIVMMPCGRM